MAKLVDSAVGPNADRPRGAPASIAPSGMDSERCNLCAALLRNESYTLELMPTRRTFVRRNVYHNVGHMRHLRLCVGCVAWFRAVIYAETGARGGGLTTERAGPTWQPEHVGDASSAYLSPEDTALLGRALEQAGQRCTALRPLEARTAASTGHGLVFAGASTVGVARMLVESVSARARLRIVVVSRYDAHSDMAGALRAGALDFLASPLSAQQISGAFERLADLRVSPWSRHQRTGLWVLSPPRLRGVQPCQVYRIGVPAGGDAMEAAWLLRRFLRGHDRVGVDRNGALYAHVFCPDEHTDEVVRRLSYILGDRAHVSFAGTLASAEEDAARRTLPESA
jgi:hypothetical protein